MLGAIMSYVAKNIFIV